MTSSSGLGGATLTVVTGGTPPVIPHITAVALSAATIQDDANIGDVVGAITVTMSSGSFSGTLSLPTNPGGYFGISGSNLVVAAALPTGPVTDGIVIRAFQNGNHKNKAQNISITAAPPAYAGPLDLTVKPAVVAYGQRALSNAKRGSAVYTIREDAGDTTQSFSSDATTGAVDAAAITAFLSGANGFVTTWVDQSASANNAVQATAGSQPGWRAAATPLLLPGLTLGAAQGSVANLAAHNLTTAGAVSLTSFSIFAVAVSSSDALASGDGNYLVFGGDFAGSYVAVEPNNSSGTDMQFYVDEYDNALNNETGNNGAFTYAAATALVFEAHTIFGSNAQLLNGVSIGSGNSNDFQGQASVSELLTLFGNLSPGGSARYLNYGLELVVFSPAVTDAAERLAIRQNIATYYGITL